jgi:hypothetical protein
MFRLMIFIFLAFWAVSLYPSVRENFPLVMHDVQSITNHVRIVE